MAARLGRRNILTNDLKEALLEAATRVGFVREVDVLDANGKPTGRKKPEWDGDGGLAGYLEWAAVFQPGHTSSRSSARSCRSRLMQSQERKRRPWCATRPPTVDSRGLQLALFDALLSRQLPGVSGDGGKSPEGPTCSSRVARPGKSHP